MCHNFFCWELLEIYFYFILGLILTMIGPHTWQYSLVQMSTVKLKQINQLTFVISDNCQIFKTKTAYQAYLLCFLSFQRQYHSLLVSKMLSSIYKVTVTLKEDRIALIFSCCDNFLLLSSYPQLRPPPPRT